jgi:hypothetical protein
MLRKSRIACFSEQHHREQQKMFAAHDFRPFFFDDVPGRLEFRTHLLHTDQEKNGFADFAANALSLC